MKDEAERFKYGSDSGDPVCHLNARHAVADHHDLYFRDDAGTGGDPRCGLSRVVGQQRLPHY
jgi:hypothetical protein